MPDKLAPADDTLLERALAIRMSSRLALWRTVERRAIEGGVPPASAATMPSAKGFARRRRSRTGHANHVLPLPGPKPGLRAGCLSGVWGAARAHRIGTRSHFDHPNHPLELSSVSISRC